MQSSGKMRVPERPDRALDGARGAEARGHPSGARPPADRLRAALRDWRLKGAVQNLLSALPGGGRINDALQTTLGELRDFERNVGGKVSDWTGILSYLRAAGRGEVRDWEIFEIGSGWYPTLPVCFALAGARRVATADLRRHLKPGLTLRMVRALAPHLERISAACGRPLAEVEAEYRRFLAAADPGELFRAARLEYLAPQDASRMERWANGGLDLVYSNSVLEHVHPQAIPALMREARRLLKPGGLMVHAVACNDHYAHFDRRISFVNYLQFPESAWRRWNNDLNYQNRLRAPDFLRLARESGFEIVHEARAVRPGTREALATLRIAPEFAHYSREDLEATTIDFVAAKGRADAAGGNVRP
jgi:SAM-dependent methyltransferase